MRVLNELENIDDELEKEGIVIIRLDNKAEAKELGIDHLPALVYYESKIPAIYEGLHCGAIHTLPYFQPEYYSISGMPF